MSDRHGVRTAGRLDNLADSCGCNAPPTKFGAFEGTDVALLGTLYSHADTDDVVSLESFYQGGANAKKRRALATKNGTQDAIACLSTDTSECSEAVGRRPGEPCSSKRVVIAIQEFVENATPQSTPSAKKLDRRPPPAEGDILPTATTGEAEAVRVAAKVLGCTSESCVVTHPEFRSFVDSEGTTLADVGGVHVLDIEIDRRFKTDGPRDSTRLLSNFDIDGVLREWAAARVDFYNFDFNMMDFESMGGSLARVDVARILEGKESQNLEKMGGMVKRRCTTFACVLNTDVSSGRGKHWVAVFGDCRGRGEWSVEYFNSAGNPPPGPVTRWLEGSAARLATFRAAHPREYGAGAVDPVPLTDVRHQDSQTECGLYALYFIRRRLEGTPYSTFREGRIPDEAMIEFRKHVFRSGD